MALPIQTALRDLGYASLGAGDLVVEFARDLPKLVKTPAEVNRQVTKQLQELRDRTPAIVREGYEELTGRGRKVADRVRHAAVVEEVTGRFTKPAKDDKPAKGAAKPKPASKTKSADTTEAA